MRTRKPTRSCRRTEQRPAHQAPGRPGSVDYAGSGGDSPPDHDGRDGLRSFPAFL